VIFVEEKLVAPCGMNCGVCISYLAMKNDLERKGFHKKYCMGCLPCSNSCSLKRSCRKLSDGSVRFCFECGDYPCKKLKALDKRYRTKYHMSMLENLEYIKKHGVEKFLEKEEEKWRCPCCGGVICCHNGLCLSCSLDTLRRNKKYRWGEEENK
jgi:hypothetical protein